MISSRGDREPCLGHTDFLRQRLDGDTAFISSPSIASAPKVPSTCAWGVKARFFWGGVCYFQLPERKGRRHGELDGLFERKVSARKLKTTIIDQFSQEHLDIVEEQVETIVENGNQKEIV